METVYKIYCASYEHALLLVETYRKDPRLQEEILETLNATVPHTGASDLSFFLVMPVQRVTKYPLLLGKILENTPTSTSAYPALQAAVRTMAQVNANINEYKRRREVATKYNKAEHLTLRDRFARLNTHSIAKKTTRLSRLLMHEAGMVAKTEDKEYDDLEEKFQCVASSVAVLKENVASYLGHLEAFLLPTPHKRELQIDEGPAQQYRRFAEYLHCTVFPEFKRRLDRLVCQPLCSLSDMLVGPQQLIKKRLDKLLDYEEIQERKSEMGSVTYDEEAAMNTYLAINALLVAELPRFNQVALQILGQILCSLSTLQRDLAAQVLHQAEKELGQMPHGHMPLPSFWKMVEDTLKQSGAQLRTFCQTFETVTPSPVTQGLAAGYPLVMDQFELGCCAMPGNSQVVIPLSFNWSYMCQAAGPHDLCVCACSPGPRGFVPAGKLQPYCPVQSQQPGMQMPALESGTERRRHSYALPEAPRPQVATFTPAFQVVAGFSFAARSPQEVSLQAGQPVVVLEPHDKKGSKEWSLVEVNGQRGYVPSSYLVTVPVQEPLGWSLPV
ncbi:ARH37 factor, partial [Ibidorhyncha struthersii]|nr:ARH37 factor [Ibidorhyncha struthersii]